MLHHGICKWDDITHCLQATAHLPPNTLRWPLDAIEKAWEHVEQRESKRHDLRKQSVNAMLGLMGAPRQYRYKLVQTTYGEDAGGYVRYTDTRYPGGSVRDDEVIRAADERGIALLFTGERHFRH
jgi:hypothetical protein